MKQRIAFLCLSIGALVGAACGGSSSTSVSTTADGGSDATMGSTSGSTGATGGSSGSTTSSGTTSSSTSTSSSSSGGNDGGGDGGASSGVPGNPIHCPAGDAGALCDPPMVCCYAPDAGVASGTCGTASACTGVAVGCTAHSCMTGDVCCAMDTAGLPGTQCEAQHCATKELELCTMKSDCAAGEDCQKLPNYDVSVCRRAGDGGAPEGGDAGDGG